MTDITPDFLSEEQSSEPQGAPEAQPVTPAAQTPEPAEQLTDVAPATEADPPAPHHVPLATFLDMRDRLAATERERQELAEWRKEQEEKARQQPVPDRNTDPEAYEDHRAAQFESRLLNVTLNNSERFATLSHGKETVEAAKAWALQRFQADPAYQQKVLTSSDPYEYVVTEWKRDQTLSRLGEGDLDAFLAWKAQQAGDPPAPATPAPVTRAPPAAPRPSLASAPAASKTHAPEARNGEDTFAAMFEK